MLTSKEAKIPNNLISVAKKTPGMTAGIVCADHDSSMDSAKKSAELYLIKPIFIGDKNAIKNKAEQIKWDLTPYEIIHSSDDKEAAMTGAELARDNKIKIIIKGNLHTDILMRTYLKKEYGLIEGKRLSHIWHMTLSENDKPLFITDGALNVSPRVDVKMHILKNVIDFAKRINISKPKVAILSGTEDPIESMPSSIEAKEIMDRAIKENIQAYVHGPLAFDNAVSPEAAAIEAILEDELSALLVTTTGTFPPTINPAAQDPIKYTIIFDKALPVSRLGTKSISACPATSLDIFLMAAASGDTALSKANGPCT